MLWKSREGKEKNHTHSSSQPKNSPPPTFSKLYPGKCSLFTTQRPLPDTLWTLPGRASISKLDLSERSEAASETLAKTSTKSSSESSTGAQHEKTPTDSHVSAAWGRERGVSEQRKPHVADKRLQNRHCWNSAPLLPCFHFTLVKHTAVGEDSFLLGTVGWQFHTPLAAGKWSDGKRGARAILGGRDTSLDTPSVLG